MFEKIDQKSSMGDEKQCRGYTLLRFRLLDLLSFVQLINAKLTCVV
jgi:hypothetical protein